MRTFEELDIECGEDYKDILLKLCELRERRKMEREIAESAGIDEKYVLIDIPSKNLILSEPRLTKTNVKIVDEDHVYPLSKFSPLAKALQNRKVQDWAIMVATPKEYVEKIKKVGRESYSLNYSSSLPGPVEEPSFFVSPFAAMTSSMRSIIIAAVLFMAAIVENNYRLPVNYGK